MIDRNRINRRVHRGVVGLERGASRHSKRTFKRSKSLSSNSMKGEVGEFTRVKLAFVSVARRNEIRATSVPGRGKL